VKDCIFFYQTLFQNVCGDGDDAASGHGDEDEATQPAAAKAAGGAAKGKAPPAGRKKK
jgi:hypothetical protein